MIRIQQDLCPIGEPTTKVLDKAMSLPHLHPTKLLYASAEGVMSSSNLYMFYKNRRALILK